jgi:hypothetical protein
MEQAQTMTFTQIDRVMKLKLAGQTEKLSLSERDGFY